MIRTPYVTYTLIALNAIAYLWESWAGIGPGRHDLGTFFATIVSGPSEYVNLNDLGALDGRLVMSGQWWRIVTGAFLHGNLTHIALNMFALLQLGTYLESAIGSWRTFVIYWFALFGAGLAVVYFSPDSPTVGASGAIFGLFGALIAIGVRLGKRGRALIGQMLPILGINLVFTFAVPSISKAGHVGGLISGFIIGFIVFAMQRAQAQPQAVAAVADAATGEPLQAEYLEPETPHA